MPKSTPKPACNTRSPRDRRLRPLRTYAGAWVCICLLWHLAVTTAGAAGLVPAPTLAEYADGRTRTGIVTGSGGSWLQACFPLDYLAAIFDLVQKALPGSATAPGGVQASPAGLLPGRHSRVPVGGSRQQGR